MRFPARHPPVDVATLRYIADELRRQADTRIGHAARCEPDAAKVWRDQAHLLRTRAQWLRNLATRIERGVESARQTRQDGPGVDDG